jgi:hypothetical protein
MNEILKYIIFFLLGIIVYYFLFNNPKLGARKLIEGFSAQIDDEAVDLTKLQSNLLLKSIFRKVGNTISVDSGISDVYLNDGTGLDDEMISSNILTTISSLTGNITNNPSESVFINPLSKNTIAGIGSITDPIFVQSFIDPALNPNRNKFYNSTIQLPIIMNSPPLTILAELTYNIREDLEIQEITEEPETPFTKVNFAKLDPNLSNLLPDDITNIQNNQDISCIIYTSSTASDDATPITDGDFIIIYLKDSPMDASGIIENKVYKITTQNSTLKDNAQVGTIFKATENGTPSTGGQVTELSLFSENVGLIYYKQKPSSEGGDANFTLPVTGPDQSSQNVSLTEYQATQLSTPDVIDSLSYIKYEFSISDLGDISLIPEDAVTEDTNFTKMHKYSPRNTENFATNVSNLTQGVGAPINIGENTYTPAPTNTINSYLKLGGFVTNGGEESLTFELGYIDNDTGLVTESDSNTPVIVLSTQSSESPPTGLTGLPFIRYIQEYKRLGEPVSPGAVDASTSLADLQATAGTLGIEDIAVGEGTVQIDAITEGNSDQITALVTRINEQISGKKTEEALFLIATVMGTDTSGSYGGNVIGCNENICETSNVLNESRGVYNIKFEEKRESRTSDMNTCNPAQPGTEAYTASTANLCTPELCCEDISCTTKFFGAGHNCGDRSIIPSGTCPQGTQGAGCKTHCCGQQISGYISKLFRDLKDFSDKFKGDTKPIPDNASPRSVGHIYLVDIIYYIYYNLLDLSEESDGGMGTNIRNYVSGLGSGPFIIPTDNIANGDGFTYTNFDHIRGYLESFFTEEPNRQTGSYIPSEQEGKTLDNIKIKQEILGQYATLQSLLQTIRDIPLGGGNTSVDQIAGNFNHFAETYVTENSGGDGDDAVAVANDLKKAICLMTKFSPNSRDGGENAGPLSMPLSLFARGTNDPLSIQISKSELQLYL